MEFTDMRVPNGGQFYGAPAPETECDYQRTSWNYWNPQFVQTSDPHYQLTQNSVSISNTTPSTQMADNTDLYQYSVCTNYGKVTLDMPYNLEYSQEDPSSGVARRNERERRRIKHINQTFATLRSMLPLRRTKRVSKVDTLRTAISYINHLHQLLEQFPEETNSTQGGSKAQ